MQATRHLLRTTTKQLPKSLPRFQTSQFHSSAAVMVKVGDSIPNIDLVEGNPGNKVNLSQELGSGLIIGVPAAFSEFPAPPCFPFEASPRPRARRVCRSCHSSLHSLLKLGHPPSMGTMILLTPLQAQHAPTPTFPATLPTPSLKMPARSLSFLSMMPSCKHIHNAHHLPTFSSTPHLR